MFSLEGLTSTLPPILLKSKKLLAAYGAFFNEVPSSFSLPDTESSDDERATALPSLSSSPSASPSGVISSLVPSSAAKERRKPTASARLRGSQPRPRTPNKLKNRTSDGKFSKQKRNTSIPLLSRQTKKQATRKDAATTSKRKSIGSPMETINRAKTSNENTASKMIHLGTSDDPLPNKNTKPGKAKVITDESPVFTRKAAIAAKTAIEKTFATFLISDSGSSSDDDSDSNSMLFALANKRSPQKTPTKKRPSSKIPSRLMEKKSSLPDQRDSRPVLAGLRISKHATSTHRLANAQHPHRKRLIDTSDAGTGAAGSKMHCGKRRIWQSAIDGNRAKAGHDARKSGSAKEVENKMFTKHKRSRVQERCPSSRLSNDSAEKFASALATMLDCTPKPASPSFRLIGPRDVIALDGTDDFPQRRSSAKKLGPRKNNGQSDVVNLIDGNMSLPKPRHTHIKSAKNSGGSMSMSMDIISISSDDDTE